MPIGDEDVTSSLDSSTSESTDTTQVQSEAASPQPSAEAAPQNSAEKTPAPSAGSAPKGTPDPVQEAIARLSRPEGGKPPAKAEKSVESTSTAPEDVSKDAPTPAKPKAGPTLDDPYAGWLETDQQRNMLKAPTRERINELHKRWKEAETHPDRMLGGEFNSMLSQHKLQDDIGYVPPDHLAGLVKAQASINRSMLAIQQGRRPAATDLQTYQALRDNLSKLDAQFGIQSNAPSPAAVTPLSGQLPTEYQDLIDIYGMSESRVRLLAALEKNGGDAKPQAPAPQAPTYTPPAQQLPEGVDMEAIHVQRITGVLAREGVPPERMAAYQKALEPTMQNIVAREFPGIQPKQIPAVFNAMSPKERADILLQAHAEFRKAQNPPVPSKPALAPSTQAPPQRTHMRAQAPTSNLDPVQSAIALLSRRDEE